MVDLFMEEALLAVRPPRSGEQSLMTFANLLEALGEGHTFSLEVLNLGGQTSLLIRTVYPDRVVGQLESHYPGCSVEWLDSSEDPLLMTDDESGWRQILKPGTEQQWLPFQVYDERKELATADPFLDVLSSVNQGVRGTERILTRVMLEQKPHDWSEAWRAKALAGAGGENQALLEEERRKERESERREMLRNRGGSSGGRSQSSAPDGKGTSMMVEHGWLYLLVLAIVGLGGRQVVTTFIDQGRIIELIAWSVVAALLLGGAAFLAYKKGWFRRKLDNTFYDPEQVAIRISGSAFRMEVQTIAVLNGVDEGAGMRAERLLDGVVSAYKGFDNPLGCRFDVSEMRRFGRVKADGNADVMGQKLLVFSDDERSGKTPREADSWVVGVREAAAVWHVPGESAEIHSLARSQRKRLEADVWAIGEGVLVGEVVESDGRTRMVRLPREVTQSHFFLTAKTRMGKSTLMGHLASGRMIEKARGLNDDALVLVDPHSDLIADVLERLPASLAQRVVVMDLGDRERTIGVNLLDTRVFPDRDKAVEAIVEVAKGIWETWGARMENIVMQVMRCLYEANRTLGRRKQFTMLDGLHMLTDEDFRYMVLDRVEDPVLLDWWQSSHGGWAREYGKEAVAPVITRLTNYSGSEVVRSILGQRRSTINMREVIERGDILLVNTNQSAVGTEVAALVGASVIKLVEGIVAGQGKGEDRQGEDETPPAAVVSEPGPEADDEDDGDGEKDDDARFRAAGRRRVCLIVDEMQSMQGVNFQRCLSELAKFGGVLVMATQSLSRLDELGETMCDAIMANVAGMGVFQVNAIDSMRLLPELRSPYLEEADLTGLPVHHCYVRMRHQGDVMAPFSMVVLPPFSGDGVVLARVEEATARYARVKRDVLMEFNAGVEERVKGFRQQIRMRVEENRRKKGNGMDFSQGRES